MKISLVFDLATGRYTLVYGMWKREFRSTNRESMKKEMMSWGVDLPDAAIAFIDLL